MVNHHKHMAIFGSMLHKPKRDKPYCLSLAASKYD